jgi:hypothetical protein
MDYIEGSNRDQLILFPQSLEEYVSDDNSVRFMGKSKIALHQDRYYLR